jgi:hypothetical protein
VLPPVGAVHSGVVDDVRGAEGPDQLDIARAADAGDLRAQRDRDLDGEMADATRGAVSPAIGTAAPSSKLSRPGFGTTRAAVPRANSPNEPSNQPARDHHTDHQVM